MRNIQVVERPFASERTHGALAPVPHQAATGRLLDLVSLVVDGLRVGIGRRRRLVFVSHAHGDEALVRSVVTLLRDGLDLKPDEFFVSSQGGRGVAPSANIREQVLNELARTPALVVVVTPKSAGRPWVWLEAGNRLGRPDRKNPIFVVPAERFLPLVSAVAVACAASPESSRCIAIPMSVMGTP